MESMFSVSITLENSRVDNRTTAIAEREDFGVISKESEDGRNQNSVVAVHRPGLCLVPFPPEFCRRCIRDAQDASVVVDLVFRRSCSRPTLHVPVVADAPVVGLPPSRYLEASRSDFADREIDRFEFPSENGLAQGFASETPQRVSAEVALCEPQPDTPVQIRPNTNQECWRS